VNPLSALIPAGSQPSNPAEAKYFERIKKDYAGLVKEYSKLEDSKGGKVINTDVARELSPEYRADRTRSADIHEPSSQLAKMMYAQKLAEPTPQGMQKRVLFSAGGTGAGKTTALEQVAKSSPMVAKAKIIYDTNMNSLESAQKKIQQALDAGHQVGVAYVHRDPVEALVKGALSRATRMEQESGTGRTVPLTEHLKTHVGARKVIEQLMNMYKDNKDVGFQVIDNSKGKGNAAPSSIDKIPKYDENELKGKLQDALQREYTAGRISPAIYAGTNS
jgi:hypothetical protein